MLPRAQGWLRPATFVSSLIVLLTLATGAPASAQDPGVTTDPGQDRLWLAGEAGVVPIDRVTGKIYDSLPDTLGAHAAVVDLGNGLLWVHRDGALSAFSLDGVLQLAVPVAASGEDSAVMTVDAADGTVWLGRGRRVWSFAPSGQALQEIPLKALVRGLAVIAGQDDPTEGSSNARIWIATEETVSLRDAVTGGELERLELDAGTEITAMAVEPGTGAVWLALTDQIVRYAAPGGPGESTNAEGARPTATISYPGAVALVPVPAVDPDEGALLWVSDGTEAALLAADGEPAALATPFAEGIAITGLRLDRGRRSVWAVAASGAARLSPSGWVLERHELGPEFQVEALALGTVTPDETGPELAFVRPEPGAELEERQPELELTWRDPGHGVRPESLELTFTTPGGEEASATCRTSPEGALCQPRADLPFGEISVTAIVADHGGLESAPASVTFTVLDPDADDPGDPAEPGGPDPAVYQPVQIDRGLMPNRAYQGLDGIDTIDLTSGNLVLRVPLGQVYSVGERLSYQLQAVHNSNGWQPVRLGCAHWNANDECDEPIAPPFPFASTNPGANAGFGWEVHLGRLFAPTPPADLPDAQYARWPNAQWTVDPEDQGQRWLYVAPDGSQHALVQLTGRDPGSPSSPVYYSKDGSYLRLRKVSNNRIEIDEPDGIITAFEVTNSRLGTVFCGPTATGVTVSGCWRFKERYDRYQNRISVDYQTGLQANREVWVISDSTGRSHTLTFDTSTAARAGGDATGNIRTQEGDEWGDLRRVLLRADVAAFGAPSAKATYNFHYRTVTMDRGCPHGSEDSVPVAANLTTVLLERIEGPESQTWEIATHALNNSDRCSNFNGRIQWIEAPSNGRLAFTYDFWEFPTQCDFRQEADPLAPLTYDQTGVRSKTHLDFDGTTELGRWDYSSQLRFVRDEDDPADHPEPTWGQNCRRHEWRETTVQGPVVGGTRTKTVSYSSVYEGPRVPSASDSMDGLQVTDHGLPYSKHSWMTSNAGRMFLSEEVFSCLSGGSCTRERSTYRRYTMEYRGCDKVSGDTAGCFALNPRPVAERTVFHTDANRWIERRWSRWNGAGQARREEVVDGLTQGSGQTLRTTDTVWTATGGTQLGIHATSGYLQVGTPSSYLPTPGSAWILHPFSRRTTTVPAGTHVLEAEFNAKGTQTCERRWQSSSGRTASDLVRSWTLGTTVGTNAGLPTQEIVAGGDTGNLSPFELCSTSGTAGAGNRFVFTHGYQSLVRSSTQTGSYPYSFRIEVDRNTGLPSRYYEVTDQWTDYDFDGLGRLVSATPDSSLDEAPLRILYHPEENSASWMEIERFEGSTVHTEELRYFDGLGRLIGETRLWPQPNGTVKRSKREILFHQDGSVDRETTWQEDGMVNRSYATEYNNYDPFGRPAEVITPDGQEHAWVHQGIRTSKDTFQVHTSPNDTSDGYRRSVYDALGQEISTITDLHRTDFTYDPGGQVTRAVRKDRATGSQQQTRLWTWDGRGFLSRESLPEVGSGPGLGIVTYVRDALGQVRRRVDSKTTLDYVYDTGGRLIRVEEGSRVWKEWVWGTSNQGDDYRLGKVVEAVRHNWIPAGPGSFADFAVRERYEYAGRLGQISARETSFETDRPYSPTMRQTWTYDALGRVIEIGYPTCVPDDLGYLACADGGDALPPTFTSTWEYDGGLPTRVRSAYGVDAAFTYHPNLQIARANFWNGTSGIFDQGTNGMARPARLQLKRGTAPIFDSGVYTFDGMGNIATIGADAYTYDLQGRLLSATVKKAGFNRREDYTYDVFDNPTGTSRDGGMWQQWSIDAKNRILGNTSAPTDIFYDAAGNMERVGFLPGSSTPIWELSYDALGLQQRYHRNTTGSEFADYLYVYGPGDLRLLEFDGVTTVRRMMYRDLDGSILREFEVQNWGLYQGPGQPSEVWTHVKDFLHGPQGLFHTRERTGANRFFFNDHLGTPRVLTTGITDTLRHYYPYGADATSSPEDERLYKYTGHTRDADNITDYMRARTCVYPILRFSSVDPGRDGWNLYAYAAGNPVKYVDPSGREAIAATAALSLGLEGGAFAAAAGPILVAGAGVGLGVAVNEIPGVSDALTIQPFSKALSEVILVFSKSKGRGLDSGLPLDEEALEKMKEGADRRTKEGKDLVRRINRQLKNLGRRNMQKDRGGPVRRIVFTEPTDEQRRDEEGSGQEIQ